MWRLQFFYLFLLSFGLIFCAESNDPSSKKTNNQCYENFQCKAGICQKSEKGNSCEITPGCKKSKDCKSLNNLPLCSQNHCVSICQTDVDCSEGNHCFDGECLAIDKKMWQKPPIYSDAEKGEFRYGFAQGRLDFPIGISMAGYGARFGSETPFQDTLGGSSGIYDFPTIKVLVLDNKQAQVVVIRTPFSWSTDYMHTKIAKYLSEKTGKNYFNNLVISATHTHSNPGRYWNLLPEVVFLGSAGKGTFNKELFDRMIESISKTALKAVQNLKYGKLAIDSLDPFDPTNKISSDRRGPNDYLKADYKKKAASDDKDNRLVIWKVVDKETGKPVIATVNFGVHGTHLNEQIISGDVPAGVEWALERYYSKKYDNNFKVIFLSGNGGDISPRGDKLDYNNVGKCQIVGYLMIDVLEKDSFFEKAKAVSEVDIKIGDLRFPISKKILGYEKEEFASKGNEGERIIHEFGAVFCVSDAKPKGSRHQDGELGCLIDVKTTRKNPVPGPQLMKSHITAVKINNSMFFTLPGEPTSRLGRNLSDKISKKHKIDLVYSLGYSQNHHLYLTTEDDYWIGGYEASMSQWGWKFGSYIEKMSMEAADLAMAANPMKAEFNKTSPSFWPKFTDKSLETVKARPIWDPDQSDKKNMVPKVLIDLKSEISRGSSQEMTFLGGDPIYGPPKVELEQKGKDGKFSNLLWPGKRPYNDEGFEINTHYLGKHNVEEQKKTPCKKEANKCDSWFFRWRESINFPVAEYRFRVSGLYLPQDQKEPKSFTIFSKVFKLNVKKNIPIYYLINKDELTIRTGYPVRFGVMKGQKFSDKGVPVYFPKYPPYNPPPLQKGKIKISKILDNQSLKFIEEKALNQRKISGWKLPLKIFCQDQNCPADEITTEKDLMIQEYIMKIPQDAKKLLVEVSDELGNSGRVEFNVK